MLGLFLLVAGALAVWIAIKATQGHPIDLNPPPGYPHYKPLEFVLGALVIAMPLTLLQKKETWAWRYVTLILLSVALTNSAALLKFSNVFKERINP